MKIIRFSKPQNFSTFQDVKPGEPFTSRIQKGTFMKIEVFKTDVNAVDLFNGEIMCFEDNDKIGYLNLEIIERR